MPTSSSNSLPGRGLVLYMSLRAPLGESMRRERARERTREREREREIKKKGEKAKDEEGHATSSAPLHYAICIRTSCTGMARSG
ncbi:hypothetical protein M0804_010475 [Polistes exclamans]|nr:hypothetical protein M0804_010475 [Polistes exclamans]